MYSKKSAPRSPSPEGPHAGPVAAPSGGARGNGRTALDAGEDDSLDELPPRLLLAFAPLHKRALGLAFGTACALLVFGVTVLHLLFVRPRDAFNLYLLREYFYGYTISWTGAFIGAWWGFFAGFVAGWFLAFGRNFALALSLFITRTRAELQQSRDFLDHI